MNNRNYLCANHDHTEAIRCNRNYMGANHAEEIDDVFVTISVASDNQICSYKLTKEQHLVYCQFENKGRTMYAQKHLVYIITATSSVSSVVVCYIFDITYYTRLYILWSIFVLGYIGVMYLSHELQQNRRKFTAFLDNI
jgi:hypothetical protein